MAGVSRFRSEGARAAFCQLYDAAVATSPMPIEQSDIDTAWGRTHVLAGGDPCDPPFVGIHGKSFNATSWLPLLPALSSRRVTLIDVPGDITKSIATKQMATAGDVVSWLDETLLALGICRTAIAGMSLGAWMAAQFAMAFPRRVESLALIGPAGLGSHPYARWLLRAYVASNMRPNPEAVASFLDTMATTRGRQRLREEPWSLIRQQFVTGTVGFRHALVGVRPSRSDLRSLAVAQLPVLAIIGSDETVHDGPKMAVRIRSEVPAARIVLVRDANHIVPVDQPETVRELLVSFFQERHC